MIAVELLHQRWVHSHEEDAENEIVFRPATFPFPRSRGRESFELRPDGELIQSRPGPTDRRETTEGTWELAPGSKLVFRAKGSAKPMRFLHVASLEKDRLVIARTSPAC